MNNSNKTIGIIGGMSWESTLLYYQSINIGVKNTLGGLHSAQIILNSLDFAPIEKLQHSGDWDGAGALINSAALSVERAGADFLLIATNTMHKVAEQAMANVNIPLLHIVDPTASTLQQAGHKKIGLIGTGFTMSDDFYKGRMSDKYGLDVIVPNPDEQAIIHNVIYQELCLGDVQPDSRTKYLSIISSLANRGAEAVILGCTEITLLVQQEHTQVPLYDTTAIHAKAAVELACPTMES